MPPIELLGTRDPTRSARSAPSLYGVLKEAPRDAKQHSNDTSDDDSPEHSDEKTTADGVLGGVSLDPAGHVGSVPFRVLLSLVMVYPCGGCKRQWASRLPASPSSRPLD